MNYIILEYAQNRELYDYVYYADKGFGELFGKLIFSQILNGIKYIHKNNITHKDLSMSNIFLDDNFIPKIGDFGLSCYNIKNFKEYFANEEYAAPEMIEHKPYDGIKADIFSLGSILIFLVYGKQGFKKADSNDKLYKLIKSGKEQDLKNYWTKIGLGLDKNLSPEFKDLYHFSKTRFKTNC